MLNALAMILALVPSQPPGRPVFVLSRAEGEPVVGAIDRIDGDGKLALVGDSPATILGADVVALRRRNMALPPGPMGPHVVFANGDRLAGEVLAIEKGRVRFKAIIGRDPVPDGTQELDIPQSSLAIIWFQSPPADINEELTRQWTGERRRRDLVRLRNGDERAGTVKEMKGPTAALVLQEEDGREAKLDSGLVVAIAMNTDLARTLRPRGPYARLVLVNGGRLSLLSPSAGSVALSAKTLFGAEIKVPLADIVALDRRQGRAVYLSDLKPATYEHRPYLSVRWPYEMDRSVAGNPMWLGGSNFDKGIGMHSDSHLTFDLNGQYRRFEAVVGLDDRTGSEGRVVVRVLLDGNARAIGFEELSSTSGAKTVRLDVNGAKQLTLAVEYGPDGDVRDHVNWADARLIK